jgi:acetyl esterase/lipase
MGANHHPLRAGWPGRWAILAVLIAASACRLTDVPLWAPARAPERACPVERIEAVAYHGGPETDCQDRRLDLYLPRGRSGYPLVLIVHGGGWVMGDKNCCGLYPSIGHFFASHGIGAAIINYRLSPGVKHPSHVRDVARAFAWLREHAAHHGANPNQIFLVGHSAGGHLVSLLATDESYLRDEGLTTRDVRGVIALSGVYRIPRQTPEYTLGGKNPLAFTLNQVLPIRGESEGPGVVSALLPGVRLGLSIFGPPFGDDPDGRDAASPVNHVRPGLPPFLLLSAEHDLPSLPPMAEEFHQALLAQGNESWLVRVPKRNHNSIMFDAFEDRDPVARTMLQFIRRHTP